MPYGLVINNKKYLIWANWRYNVDKYFLNLRSQVISHLANNKIIIRNEFIKLINTYAFYLFIYLSGKLLSLLLFKTNTHRIRIFYCK